MRVVDEGAIVKEQFLVSLCLFNGSAKILHQQNDLKRIDRAGIEGSEFHVELQRVLVLRMDQHGPNPDILCNLVDAAKRVYDKRSPQSSLLVVLIYSQACQDHNGYIVSTSPLS